MFGRKKKQDAAQEPGPSEPTDPAGSTPSPEAEVAAAPGTEDATAATVPDGPRDRTEVDEVDGLVDLGSVYALPSPGMELRLELDATTGEVSALQIGNDDGAVQVQVFAAPRTSGIWPEIRGEIAEMVVSGGGTAEEVDGAFGTELRTRLAQQGPQGRTVFAPAVFAGVDGPRWFLRAVYSGGPAVEETARARFDECVRTIVVTRGDEPRAPREMLPLTMPTTAGPAQTGSEDPAEDDDLKPFERGPEITEVR